MIGYFPDIVIGKSPKQHNMFEETIDFSETVNLVQVLIVSRDVDDFSLILRTLNAIFQDINIFRPKG